MNPEESQLLFAARIDVFDPISGQTTNADLTRLYEELATILLRLPYDVEKGVHNLMGLFIYEYDYNQCYCAKFPTPTRTSFCDEMITNNTTNVVQDKAEAVNMAKISDYLLFATAKCETRDFILAVIEDT